MIIDFTNRITEAKVQQMINDAMDFTTGVINLSNATAEQVKTAFTDPDRWLCTITYSGATYMEQYRIPNSGGTTVGIYFYVPGASADTTQRQINDGVYFVSVDTTTGAVSDRLLSIAWAPNIIYELDKMNAEQLKFLNKRINNNSTRATGKNRFSAVWTHNGKTYVYSAGILNAVGLGNVIAGTAIIQENGAFAVYYDMVSIDTQGTLIHNEFSSNIVLTYIQ